MTMPTFTMRQLLEAGIHFGHHTRRWNPKMKQYIFGVRSGVHIIDLQQTMPMLGIALKTMRDIVANGGRVLFVGTKRQAQEKIKDAARRSGQYYVNQRWLGGMLTNWKTVSKSINRLRELDDILDGDMSERTKKEILMLTRESNKLELSIGGIKEMGGLPNALFIIDTNKEAIAVSEANNLKIPVFAVIDTNSNPDGIDFPIPGNDDAQRAIGLYCDLATAAILDGLQAELGTAAAGSKAKEEVLPDKAKVKEMAKAKENEAGKKEDKPEKEDKAKKENSQEKAENEKKSDAKPVDSAVTAESTAATEEELKKQASA